MGRPPKQHGRKVKHKTVWLYPDALDRVQKLVGDNGVSEFIREAIDRELKRREREQAKAGAGSPD